MNMQLNHMSLRQQVYEILREYLGSGQMCPGDSINLDKLAEQLRISRTPLREALLRLEIEGLVTIRPRSGIVVRVLAEQDIRNLYQMIGALESSALRNAGKALTENLVATMRQHNDAMRAAITVDILDNYYAANLSLHNIFMNLSDNEELKHQVKIMKLRLFEFAHKSNLIMDWEKSLVKEHEHIISLLEKGEIDNAADYLRDVHWSFEIQKKYIRKYYLDLGESRP